MTDSKRNSVVGRVATPRSASSGLGAPQGISDQDSALSKAIGARIRVTTSLPNSAPIEGTLFTACPITNIVAINTAPATARGDYHLVPVAQITSFDIVSTASEAENAGGAAGGFTQGLPSISKVDLDALKAREEDAIRKIKDIDSTRGKGVTREAQEIFDWFKRTLPTRWSGTTIIVNESVMVNAPYTVNDLKAPKDKQQAEGHVKRVLEGYYAKKKPNNGPNAPVSNVNNGTNTPTGNRPIVPAVPKKGG